MTNEQRPIHTDRLAIDDAVIHYERTGNGPDVLFIHGWPLTGATWRNIVPAMDGFTCHVIDLPGIGRSTDARPPRGFFEQADAVIEIAEALGLERYSLVGHDSGGFIARVVASRTPERVDAVVAASTEIPGHHPWQLRVYSLSSRLPGNGAGLRLAMGFGPVRRSKLAFGACFADKHFAERTDFARLFLSPLFGDDDWFAGQFGAIKAFDHHAVEQLPDVHAKITCSTLLLWGDDDTFFPADRAREMADQFAGPTDFVLIPGGRLFAHEEFPDEFTRAISAFLAPIVGAVPAA